MTKKKSLILIVPSCIVLGGLLLLNFIMPRDFRKTYNEDNDLITTFFQLYKTDESDTKEIVDGNKNYSMNYKIDLIGGLRQLSIEDDNYLYVYTLSQKAENINISVYNSKMETSSEVLKGKIEHSDKLSIERFNIKALNNENQEYFEKQVLTNLRLIFNEIYKYS